MRNSDKASKFIKALTTRTLEFEYWGMPFRRERVPVSRLLNLALFELWGRRRCAPARYPIELQAETSRACSLRCPLCPAGVGLMENPREMMTFSTFRSIIDDVGEYLLIAMLWGYGEPLLNRKLPEMIAYAQNKGIVTIVSTNGQHVESTDIAESLVVSGIDGLVVNMDGSTEETYSRYRVGGSLEKVIRCLDFIRDAKKSLGSERPIINVQTVVTRQNEHQLGEIENLARVHGADLVSRLSCHMPDYTGSDSDEQFAPTNPKYRRFEYNGGERARRSINDYRCARPLNRLTVAWNGAVLPCVQDFNASRPLGRPENGVSFRDIWWGETASAFRRQFRRAKSAYSFCADCHFRDNTGPNMVDSTWLR